MSEHDVPDDSSLKGYTDITPDDSGADIVVKVFGASDKNMHPTLCRCCLQTFRMPRLKNGVIVRTEQEPFPISA